MASESATTPPFMTVPIVLVALLRQAKFSVTLYPDKGDGALWHFRFTPRSLLEMHDDGAFRWKRCSGAVLRCRVETIIAEAQALLARTRH